MPRERKFEAVFPGNVNSRSPLEWNHTIHAEGFLLAGVPTELSVEELLLGLAGLCLLRLGRSGLGLCLKEKSGINDKPMFWHCSESRFFQTNKQPSLQPSPSSQRAQLRGPHPPFRKPANCLISEMRLKPTSFITAKKQTLLSSMQKLQEPQLLPWHEAACCIECHY